MFYIGIIIICLVGTLLHFTYEFSHHNKYVALFSAVNESTWEHIKICMTPTILWSIYEIVYDNNYYRPSYALNYKTSIEYRTQLGFN